MASKGPRELVRQERQDHGRDDQQLDRGQHLVPGQAAHGGMQFLLEAQQRGDHGCHARWLPAGCRVARRPSSGVRSMATAVVTL
jgi:hypothetical protein